MFPGEYAKYAGYFIYPTQLEVKENFDKYPGRGMWQAYPIDHSYNTRPLFRYPFLASKSLTGLINMIDFVNNHSGRHTIDNWNFIFEDVGLVSYATIH